MFELRFGKRTIVLKTGHDSSYFNKARLAGVQSLIDALYAVYPNFAVDDFISAVDIDILLALMNAREFSADRITIAE